MSSSNIAIRCEGLSKRYRIGVRRVHYKTLRDSLTNVLLAPWRKWRNGQWKDADENGGTIWALKDVSFEVKQGEIVGIIGRNGSGKSTLLKILSRITDPTEGYAEVRGRVRSLLEVGTGFHPELTGRENIFLNGAILEMKRQELEHKFDEIVAFAEVDRFIDTPVKFYSSGMYVRLAFAVAAQLEPEILLIDEVLSVGDASFQKKCLGKMGEVAQSGRTVLYVSHNLASVVNLCKRTILLNEGRVLSEGESRDVVQRYLELGRTTRSEVVWERVEEAPGNDWVRLHAVRVFQEGVEGPTLDLDISKEIEIEISYWNLCEGARLYAAIWLRDPLGSVILSSGCHKGISLTQDRWYGHPRPKGLFRSVCRIPGNFLNEGIYSIDAILGKGVCETHLQQEYVLSFHVHDTGEMRKEYSGGWNGTIRPRLAWETEYLGAEAKVSSGI